jgi:hypothetical protein
MNEIKKKTKNQRERLQECINTKSRRKKVIDEKGDEIKSGSAPIEARYHVKC